MALEIKQGLRLSQSLVMTPQLQQAIKLLQLNRMELMEVVNQELVENPVLEEMGESTDSENEVPGEGDYNEDGSITAEAQQTRDEEGFDKPSEPQTSTEEPMPTQTADDDINWDQYIEEFQSSGSTAPSMKESMDDMPSFEATLAKSTSLEEHLMWQISMLTLSDDEKHLGSLIIGNLSDEGYLNADLAELAKESDIEFEDAEELLRMIQNFDPIGVGSRNLKECLLLQASFLKPRNHLVERLINEFMSELERKNYQAIVKASGETLENIIAATRVIMEFEPKPGRSYQSNDAQYITPDIYVYKLAGEFVI
ncbi:MAG: RNA polymerase sigma-54 factor, partial [Proteobacteria bacterium]